MIPDSMKQFIDEVYHVPYTLLVNNCFDKSARIVKKAHGLGIKANLVVVPISIVPRQTFPYLPVILPHCYVEIEGEKVDVARDPNTEEVWCNNRETKSFFPITLPGGIG